MQISATIEVMDTEIDVEVDDDATDEEIEEAIIEAAQEQLNILNWEKND